MVTVVAIGVAVFLLVIVLLIWTVMTVERSRWS